MNKSNKHIQLMVEMAVIVAIASLIGIGWNQKLLRQMLEGKPIAPQARTAATPQPATVATPLPLGLEQAKDLHDRKEATFVDARNGKDYAAGHIKGAISLPLGDFAKGLARLKEIAKPETTLVVYCNGFDCQDSMELGSRLIKAGFGNVYVYLGGFPEWKDAGYAVEGGKP